MNNIVSFLPDMLSGKEIMKAMTVLPNYNNNIRRADATKRLLALSDLYQIYIPSVMSMEIYSKVYLALHQSFLKKENRLQVIRQGLVNADIRNGGNIGNGIIGGSDSFTIIGPSGIGKSSALSQSIGLLEGEKVFCTEMPYQKMIPILNCQCPFDCSVKGFLYEVLRLIDSRLDSNYYTPRLSRYASTDALIGIVSQVLMNHVGLLIVDEIQNVCVHKNGNSLVRVFTQLINNSGISICMVGTPESELFFEQKMQLARRSIGLRYEELPYDEFFQNFCRKVYAYQYVRHKSEITEGIMIWLYEHSAGLPSTVISLLHDAQEIAIIKGQERLNLEVLNQTYQERMKLMQQHIIQKKKTITKRQSRVGKVQQSAVTTETDEINLYQILMEGKRKGEDACKLLKDYITVEEVTL